MHGERLIEATAPGVPGPAIEAREGDAATLHTLLQAARADTLATFAALEAQLPGLQVPQAEHLNPPLWELGHVGWFQGRFTTRHPGWHEGPRAAHTPVLHPPRRPGADALYDSSHVPHAARWQLPLPDAATTRADLAAQLDATLQLLAVAADAPTAAARTNRLYPFRLVLHHEDMHHEAALYMAESLGLALPAGWAPPRLPDPPPPLALPAAVFTVGHGSADAARGFVFDNELGPQAQHLPAVQMDAQAVRWAEFLPFAEDGGYDDERLWTAAGWAWRQHLGARHPPALRREGTQWRVRRDGRWSPLDLAEPARHLTAHEAAAWCRWAGRRLPTEAEWERAALHAGSAFRWGDVWEWTASPFAPYPGFQPHPYRDYSLPWFDGRPVLRGGSHLTQPRMKHPRYRNYFPAHRADVPAGFRSCR